MGLKYIGGERKYSGALQRGRKWSNGWTFDWDMIPVGSNILSIGVGTDIGFDLELIEQKDCHIWAVDPLIWPDKRVRKFLKECHIIHRPHMEQFYLVNKYFSWFSDEMNINLEGLLARNHLSADRVSVFKMDIEGHEYGVIDQICNSRFPQIGIEFHHWYDAIRKPDFDFKREDTIDAINKLKAAGYYLVHNDNPERGKKYWELLFIRKDLAIEQGYEDIKESDYGP